MNAGPRTIRDWLAAGRAMLAQQPAGALEAELLLCHTLGVERAWLYANGGEDPGKRRLESYLSLVNDLFEKMVFSGKHAPPIQESRPPKSKHGPKIIRDGKQIN